MSVRQLDATTTADELYLDEALRKVKCINKSLHLFELQDLVLIHQRG